MGKTKSAGQKSANSIAQQPLHEIKNGSVKKNKKSKFKNTSVSKVALIDNAQNKNVSPHKNLQKNVNSKNSQNLPKGKIKQSKKKNESPKEKQNSPNAQNKHVNKKNNLESKKELLEMDDSDSDIDEGTVPHEYSRESINETFEDEESSDTDVPNIFGTSLAEDSDEDDEDFEDEEKEKDEDDEEIDEEEDNDSYEEEEEEDEYKKEEEQEQEQEEKNIEHKRVKMFKGIQNVKPTTFTELDKICNEDDEQHDFNESEDEDDMDESDEEVESNQINTSASGIEEDDEDNDDEGEDEDEDSTGDENEIEDEDAALGIEALLGKTIADDDDDEDFNEDDEDDEDDDISDEDDDDEGNDNTVKVSKEKKAIASNNKASSANEEQTKEKKLSADEQEEINKRTICIDNIPKEIEEKNIKKVFGQYGAIDSIRLRGIVPQHLKMSKKVAAITGQIHSKSTTVVAYINYKSQESAKKALNMNGKLFEGNYVNVKIVAKSEQQQPDPKKAVFIGNLKFGIGNNVIWKTFSECGEIESVHLIRDSQTGQTKGFGYVNFKSKDAVVLALKLNGIEVCDRPIRVSPCLNKDNEKTNKKGKKRHFSGEDDSNNSMKKFKDTSRKIKTHPAQHEGTNVKKQQKTQKNNEKIGGKNSASFQGQTADLKGKKKGNKFDKKKKLMAEKLKPKKATKA